MQFETFSDSDSDHEEPLNKSEEQVLPYLGMIFTKSGIAKIENGKSLFKLPLKDLKDPPRLGNLYTVGDLIELLKKHNYLLDLVEGKGRK